MRVLIQLRHSPVAARAAAAVTPEPALTTAISTAFPGLVIDHAFPPVQIPSVGTATGAPLVSMAQPLTFSTEAEASTYLVRGAMPDEAVTPMYANLLSHPDVIGIFSDPTIATQLVCSDSPAVGSDDDVARLLNVEALQAAGMDGSDVVVAVVDAGINLDYLQGKGRNPDLDVASSFTPKGVQTEPGQHALGHGSMCAYDVGIAAPNAKLLDDAVLLSKTPGSTYIEGVLSDAIQAYSKLFSILKGMPEDKRALVVTNSWGMFSQKWDFPPGHPGNYSDNPNHPFNIIVASLENAGADILFAAGNCGRDCPDERCDFKEDELPICGANSHPSVISVAGVDTTKERVGYSSQGPGRLSRWKPDITAYTHFDGSGVFPPADRGTSAACPVAAGVVAAVRSQCPSTKLSPAQLRLLIHKTAEPHRGTVGFNSDYGWGIINPAQLIVALATGGLIPPTSVAATVGGVVGHQIEAILALR